MNKNLLKTGSVLLAISLPLAIGSNICFFFLNPFTAQATSDFFFTAAMLFIFVGGGCCCHHHHHGASAIFGLTCLSFALAFSFMATPFLIATLVAPFTLMILNATFTGLSLAGLFTITLGALWPEEKITQPSSYIYAPTPRRDIDYSQEILLAHHRRLYEPAVSAESTPSSIIPPRRINLSSVEEVD